MSDEMPTPEQDKKTGRFVAGNSGNGGRQKGSRSKLGEMFLNDLQTLWEKEGSDVLTEARKEKPMDFARMIAGILPKELLVRKAPEDELSDDELATAIDQLAELAAHIRDNSEDIKPTHGGAGTA